MRYLLIAFAISACFDISSVKAAPLEHPCSVTLYGDSILNGATGATHLAEVPAAAIKRLRPSYTVVDKTAVGNYVVKHLNAFLKEPITTQVVVIQYGINDAILSTAYIEPLRAMVKHVVSLGKIPVITGLSRVPADNAQRIAYNAMAKRVAETEKVIFADWDAVAFYPAEMYDFAHPAQPYSTRLTVQLVAALDWALPNCAK